jgi:hypothetical protein
MGIEVNMKLYKIRYRFTKLASEGGRPTTVSMSESFLLDEEAAQDFLAELKKYLDKLEGMPISANAKVKKVKYFIKVYQLVDLSHSMKTITIEAKRNAKNGMATIELQSEPSKRTRYLDGKLEGSESEQFSGQVKPLKAMEI